MRLSAGIEVLAGLDDATRDRTFGDSLRQMWGMRNRIAHGYLMASPAIVRTALERDLPGIIGAVERAIASRSLLPVEESVPDAGFMVAACGFTCRHWGPRRLGRVRTTESAPTRAA